MSEPAWTGRSRGGGFGTRLMCWCIRYGGRDLAYILVVFPALWFFLRERRARHAINRYWRQLRPGISRISALLHSGRHFWEFARMLVDRVLTTQSPTALTFTTAGLDHLLDGQSRGKGCILLSAHIGSFELAARLLIRERQAMLNLVMLDHEDPQVQAHLQRALGARPYRVIDLRDPTGASLAIAAALARDEMCCMLGDRVLPGSTGSLSVPFLGAPMAFPTGPFIAAAATGATIIPTFCLRSGWATWHCAALTPFTVDLGPRREREARLAAIIGEWAAVLEQQVRQQPYAWNNYFDVWKLSSPAPT